MENNHNAVSNDLVICDYQLNSKYSGVKHFDCGNSVINSFVRSSLRANVKGGNCAAKVLIDEGSGELLGFCSFSGFCLNKAKLSGTVGGSLPNDVGVVRLNMLGVATKEQNKGHGQKLLCVFFEHIKVINKVLPIKGVYLDAYPDAISFYELLGFVQLKEPPNSFGAVPMFLSIQHIIAA